MSRSKSPNRAEIESWLASYREFRRECCVGFANFKREFQRFTAELQPLRASAAQRIAEEAPLRKSKEHLLAERWEDWAPGWVCGRYVEEFRSPENFLCAFTDDPTGVLAPLITAFWEMVRDTEAAVTAVNTLVAAK